MTEKQLAQALDNWRKYRERSDERPQSCWHRDLTEAEIFATRRHIEQIIQNPELDWYTAIENMPNPCALKVAMHFSCFKLGGAILLQMFKAAQDQK